jgi:hypothetical protein
LEIEIGYGNWKLEMIIGNDNWKWNGKLEMEWEIGNGMVILNGMGNCKWKWKL